MESITLAPVEGYSGDMMNDSECLDTMVQMSMIDRSTSLSRILASKTSSTMLTTDPTMRSRDEILGGKSSKRSSGVLGRLFTKSGQSISEEERAARKQARALRRAQSLDFLSRDPRDSRRRFKSTTVLTKELFQILQGQTTTEFETASLSMDLNTPTSVAPEGTLESPSSPTLQDILEGQVGKDMLKVSGGRIRDGSPNPEVELSNQDSLMSLKDIEKILVDLKASLPRRYSEQVASIQKKAEGIEESPSGFLTVPSSPVSSNTLQAAERLGAVIERYKFIRNFSIVDEHERPVICELLNELDAVIGAFEEEIGIDEQSEQRATYEQALNDVDFNPNFDLIDCQKDEKAFSSPSRPPILRDLSHEILSLNSPKSIVYDSGDITFGDLVKVKSPTTTFATSRSFGVLPVSPLSMSRAEMNYYGDVLNEAEIVQIDEATVDPLVLKIHANHRVCMQQGRTSLPLSFAEIQGLFSTYSNDIDFNRESSDPKHLLLVPLNDASVPRWVKPGSRFRVGRNSPWLQGKSRVVSRNHCEVFHDIDSFYLYDVGSSSGTFINGVRISEEQRTCPPRLLESGDVLQVGVDYYPEEDQLGNLELEFKSVQALILLGYPKKATAEMPSEIDQVTNLRVARPQAASLVSWAQIHKITTKAKKFPSRMEGSNLRIYVELGDILHSDGAGMAVAFYGDKLAFSAVFNNYKMNWEMAMTDAEGSSTIILDALPNSSTAYSVMKDRIDLARITAITPQKLVIAPACSYGLGGGEPDRPLSPFSQSAATLHELPSATEEPKLKPFYTIAGDLKAGTLYILQRSHTDRKQMFIGEAILTSKRRRWGKGCHLLEARLLLPPEYEQLLVMGTLFTTLVQLESGSD